MDANAGLYAVLAARAVGGSGHVYAFEPDGGTVALLRYNIAINNLANVTVIEAAASNQSGTASFAAATDTAMSSLANIDRQDQQIHEWRTVRTIRVDDAVEQHGIRRVTFIKMDVEGAEKLALEGASNLLGRASRITILFEAVDKTPVHSATPSRSCSTRSHPWGSRSRASTDRCSCITWRA